MTFCFQPGMYVHARASANSKRVQVKVHFFFSINLLLIVSISFAAEFLLLFQSNVGAKSHVVVMPDVHMDTVINALVCAGFGSAVQRCTAISTVIFVGDSKSWYAIFIHDFKMNPVGGEWGRGQEGPHNFLETYCSNDLVRILFIHLYMCVEECYSGYVLPVVVLA